MLTTEERVELILLCGREGYSQRDVAAEFNQRHPEREPVSHSTVGRLLAKFKSTGSVHDASRSGRPCTTADTEEVILAKVAASPRKSTRRTSMELGIPRTTLRRVLKKHRWHPYKLQLLHHMTEDDPDRRMEMCDWFLRKLDDNAQFLSTVMFSDEANFYVNGEVNRQNLRYWSDSNPHWFTSNKEQGAARVMVWCGLWKDRIIGPYFFHRNVDSETYLTMLGDSLLPTLDAIGSRPEWFMQDGAPPHYAIQVRTWLDDNFPQWIGRRGRVEWAPRSPDLNPMDFAIWGYLKSRVYAVKIRDANHLQERIVAECRAVTPNLVANVLWNMGDRLQTCFDLNGSHIEHIIT